MLDTMNFGGVHVVQAAKDLAQIHAPECAGVLWQRDVATDVQMWIDTLDPTRLPHARMILRPSAVPEALDHLCDIAGAGPCLARQWLQDDIAALSTCFSDLMQTAYLRLRLDVVTTNSCSKFHLDAMNARLICTYRGTGTQYGVLTDAAVPDQIFTVPTGSPMILRGSKWPEVPVVGLRHRSPPISGTGESRLVLVLDPMDAAA